MSIPNFYLRGTTIVDANGALVSEISTELRATILRMRESRGNGPVDDELLAPLRDVIRAGGGSAAILNSAREAAERHLKNRPAPASHDAEELISLRDVLAALAR